MSPSGTISEAMVEAGARALLMAKFGPEAGMLFEPVPDGFEKSAEAQAMFTKRTDEARQEARAAITAALSVPTPGTGEAEELRQIDEMLDEGQGDDEGAQILPDFEPGMSVLAKVEKCLFLLEKRRDVIAAYGDDRLFDANAPMADGEIRMTAAEDVLAWLLIEKIGVPDDTTITPKQAQDTIVHVIDGYHEYERAALSSSPVGEMVPITECASEGCGKQATVRFERGGIGSYYCHDCYMRIQALPAIGGGR